MMLPNIQLTIEDSEFHNSSSTAVTFYWSFAILHAKVINSGTKGGAIALIGSALTIERNALVIFKNNHAYETGGAIYADNIEPHIKWEGFRSYCFCMLDTMFLEIFHRFWPLRTIRQLLWEVIISMERNWKVIVYPQASVMTITVDLVLKQLEMCSSFIQTALQESCTISFMYRDNIIIICLEHLLVLFP